MLNSRDLTPTKPIQLKRFILLFVFVLLVTGVFYLILRLGDSPKDILPPELYPAEQTYEQVMSFIKRDDTNTIEYREGFNCVDSSIRLWLNARWQGIAAYPMRINYENSLTHHMVVIFPTADRGDLIIEPQEDVRIRPQIGKLHNGKMVNGLYILEMSWLPIGGSPALDSSYGIE